MSYNKNTFSKKENIPENSYARKNSSNNGNVNFSTRNTKKKRKISIFQNQRIMKKKKV